MKEIHCSQCDRFLCKLEYGELEIKCPNGKCKHLNRIKVVSTKILRQLTPEQETAILQS